MNDTTAPLDFRSRRPAPIPLRYGRRATVEDGLDFINTLEFSRDAAREDLGSPDALLEWLADRQLLDDEACRAAWARFAAFPEAGEAALARARTVRAALREVIEAVVDGRRAAGDRLDELNRVLRSRWVYEFIDTPEGVALALRQPGDPIEGDLAQLVEGVIGELVEGHPERLRVCANDQCRWVFTDASRAGSRRWCSMKSCGNRAKAARHRARLHATAQVAE